MNKQLMAAALLIATAALPAAASAQTYNHGYNGGNNGSRTQGTIGSVRGSNIQLTDGRNVFLHNGTVINPTGTSLQPGQQIFVTGSRGGNGAINADQINVNGYGNGNGGNNRGYGDNGNQWNHHHHDRDNDDNH